jgi:primosomal protein N' (replication factor Y)
MKILECWMEHPVRELDRTFTYLCEEEVEPGSRVKVNFHNRHLIGFVESVEETDLSAEEIEKEKGYKIRMVDAVIDHTSLLTDELHDLAMQMKHDNICPAIACFQCILPAKLKPAGKVKTVVHETWAELSDQEVSLTPKQLEMYLYVKEKGKVLVRELRKKSPSITKALIDKGALVLTEKEREAASNAHVIRPSEVELTPRQKEVIAEINGSDDPVFLLRGVTGAGKTEVYLQLAAQVLQKGRQVLILVPEIGLTPQMIQRVTERFGDELAIYHSGLSDQEKYEQYRKVRTGQAAIVVGTRSAVFLPFDNLGLIVMDEEHDPSYKQENQPAYHCRDIAIARGKYHHCKVILGSATPTLDSYARGLRHVYHLVEMPERINRSLPVVTVVDMKEEGRKGGDLILSSFLKEKMKDRLEKGERIILMLNRRGYNTQLRCRSCGEVLTCPHCDLAMSYHRQIRRMKCHTCGCEMPVPRVCPKCGSQEGFMTYGFGTEKLEAEVRELFPEASVLRMDADTTSRKNAHHKILQAFSEGKADILLGTQMIAKGLDFPEVTLVGIINGDNGLARTDFRSCETTFDLLMQAAGRSGRGTRQGEVIFQVFNPDHYAVIDAARQDYLSFFREEMKYRHIGQYPPYTYLISLLIKDRDQHKVDATSLYLKEALHGSYRVIGIIQLLKINDMFRSRIVLKGKNLEEMRADVRDVLLDHPKAVMASVIVDVNPMTLE